MYFFELDTFLQNKFKKFFTYRTSKDTELFCASLRNLLVPCDNSRDGESSILVTDPNWHGGNYTASWFALCFSDLPGKSNHGGKNPFLVGSAAVPLEQGKVLPWLGWVPSLSAHSPAPTCFGLLAEPVALLPPCDLRLAVSSSLADFPTLKCHDRSSQMIPE